MNTNGQQHQQQGERIGGDFVNRNGGQGRGPSFEQQQRNRNGGGFEEQQQQHQQRAAVMEMNPIAMPYERAMECVSNYGMCDIDEMMDLARGENYLLVVVVVLMILRCCGCRLCMCLTCHSYSRSYPSIQYSELEEYQGCFLEYGPEACEEEIQVSIVYPTLSSLLHKTNQTYHHLTNFSRCTHHKTHTQTTKNRIVNTLPKSSSSNLKWNSKSLITLPLMVKTK
jgi:hypothetical protein